MTSLHYLLIALGVALVALVALYNHFVERRYRKQAEKIFAQTRQDISLGNAPEIEAVNETRIEPRFELIEHDSASAAAEAPEAAFEAEAEGETAAQGEAVPAAEAAPPAAELRRPSAPIHPEPESLLDVATEYIARVRYGQPSVLAFAPLLEDLRRISKPVRALGHLGEGGWTAITPHGGQAYDTVEFSLLLDDRSGPVSAVQLDTFCKAVHAFATEHGGTVSCPDRKAALERGRQLDAFCAEVDVLIGINVVAPDQAPFAGEAIHRIASAAGLKLGADGAYVLHDPQGRLLFSLVNQGETPFPPGGTGLTSQGISLIFDVPRVADGLRVFDRMTALGFDLAERLDGRLMGDGGYPVSAETLEKDRQRLLHYYARMDAQGLAAGSERALRVFA